MKASSTQPYRINNMGISKVPTTKSELKNGINHIRHLPAALKPKYDSTRPNRPLRLYSGVIEIEQRGKTTQANGSLTFQWLPEPHVRFSGTRDLTSHFEASEVRVRIPAIRLDADALLVNLHLEGSSQQISGRLNGLFNTGQPAGVQRIDFQLANFHEINGEPIRISMGKHVRLNRGRLVLTDDNYLITIDQVDRYSERINKVKAAGGFIVGHGGRIEKKDNSLITPDEAEDLLTALHTFLSFCCGRWCGPMFGSGCSDRNVVWQQLGSWKVSHWKNVSSWFPFFEPAEVTIAWNGFSQRWHHIEWEYPLKIAVHWFVEANLGVGATEGSIVLTQTALELLCWAYLVEEQHLFTTKDFNSLSAAEKIRYLLSHLAIPVQIPPQLKSLQAASASFKTPDGPGVFVAIRNGLVHPKKVKRDAVANTLPLARWEARQIGLWYLELAILRLSSYTGVYYNRLKTGYLSKAKEKVPWAP